MCRLTIAAGVTALLACAPLLGGLDEGTSRRPEDAGVDAPESAPACRTLAGYTYRVPIRVEHHGPAIRGYQVKLVFPTRDLVASGHMRADGADIAITLADGTTRVPHWLQDGVGTDKTTLWTRLDLGEEPFEGWLYYGAPQATDQSSSAETFVEAAIVNPNFDRNAGWSPFADRIGPSSSSHQWSLTLADGKAQLFFATDPHPNGYEIGWCTDETFPDGVFRLIFDFELLNGERSWASIEIDSNVTSGLWGTQTENIVAPAVLENIETMPFRPSGTYLCLKGTAPGSTESTSLKATFTALRLRRWVDGDRIATVQGVETVTCVP